MLTIFDVLTLLFVFTTSYVGGLLGLEYGIAGMILGIILEFLVGNGITQLRGYPPIIYFLGFLLILIIHLWY